MAHLIRLLRTGKEILQDGVVHVFRPDAKELLEIRNGALSYDELLSLATSTEKEVKEAYEKTKLPDNVDLVKIEYFVTGLYLDHWESRELV